MPGFFVEQHTNDRCTVFVAATAATLSRVLITLLILVGSLEASRALAPRSGSKERGLFATLFTRTVLL